VEMMSQDEEGKQERWEWAAVSCAVASCGDASHSAFYCVFSDDCFWYWGL
jgi:hypothetical protein